MNEARRWFWSLAMIATAGRILAGCGTSTTILQCVPGATQFCACTTGDHGSQTCGSGGTFDPCTCDGADAGLLSDAGLMDADAEDAMTVIMDDASSACPGTLVSCAGRCIDPTNDPAYCGASGDCAGANAGASCAGTWCSAGRCVWHDCYEARQAGNTTDGIYLLDIDASGPREPMDGYCDMTTDGGGWTLVYKVGNTVPDVAEPWYAMVALGSGTALPTTTDPLSPGTYFEGPDRATRLSCQRLTRYVIGVDEWRAELISAAGTMMFDVRSDGNWSPLAYIALGLTGSPLPIFGGGDDGGVIVLGSTGSLPPVGSRSGEGGYGCSGCSNDWDGFYMTSTSTTIPIVGDSSITMAGSQFANTTALIWTRPHYGSWP